MKIWEIIKVKLKSQTLWIAVLALIYLHISKMGNGIDFDKLNNIVNSMMELAVLLGITHNPDKIK